MKSLSEGIYACIGAINLPRKQKALDKIKRPVYNARIEATKYFFACFQALFTEGGEFYTRLIHFVFISQTGEKKCQIMFQQPKPWKP